MKAFPKPLTATEERECLEKWKAGDLAARDVLIERNMRLVAHISKKYNGDGRDLDDLISIGTIGLIKAVRTFDPEKNSKLATYAAKCIENEILMSLRLEKKYGREVSLYDPIGTDKEGNMISLVDVVEADGREVVEEVALGQEIEQMYRAYEQCLRDKEKKVIRMRYGLFGSREYTQREIAGQMHISRSYVSRIENAALLKMRAMME